MLCLLVIVVYAFWVKGYHGVGFLSQVVGHRKLLLTERIFRGTSRAFLSLRPVSTKYLLDVDSLSFLLPSTLWAAFHRTTLPGRPATPVVVDPRLVHA